MKYGYLGKSGMKVSKICLGCAGFGAARGNRRDYGGVPRDEAFRIMDVALDRGINFFDTANVYGGYGADRGTSERIIGEWFAQGNERRERVVLATKVGRVFDAETVDGPNKEFGLSLYKIRRHFRHSLERLQTDHVELYQMHRYDPNVAWDELWEAFECLVRDSQVDYIGACNFDGGQLTEAQSDAERRHFMGLVSNQNRYNLLVRTVEDVFPAAKKLGVGITVWSPLARGLLALDMESVDYSSLSTDSAALIEQYRPQLEQYSKLCHELGEPGVVVALAWLLANPVVSAVVIGPSSVEEFESALRATEVELDSATLEKLDEIFPPPLEHFVAPSEAIAS